MITWLTRKGYGTAAKDLDDERLLRQLKNTVAILDMLQDLGRDDEEYNNPELKMWRGYEYSLCMYGQMCVMAAMNRHMLSDKNDAGFFRRMLGDMKDAGLDQEKPPWHGDVDIIRSHRSRLVQIDPKFYGPVFPGTPKNMPVLWPQPLPVSMEPQGYRLRIVTHDIVALNDGRRELPPHLYYNPNQNEILRRSA